MQTLYGDLLLIVYIKIALIKACPHLRIRGDDMICSQVELSNVHHVLLLISGCLFRLKPPRIFQTNKKVREHQIDLGFVRPIV